MQVLEPVWRHSSLEHPCLHPRARYSLRCFGSCAPTCAVTLTGHGTVLKLNVRKFYPPSTTAYLNRVIRPQAERPRCAFGCWTGIIDSAAACLSATTFPIFRHLYLSELDHLLKEDVGLRYYYRYADDIVLLSDSKGVLSGVLVYINHYLNDSRLLTLKATSKSIPWKVGASTLSVT